jgi:hypothetical protein
MNEVVIFGTTLFMRVIEHNYSEKLFGQNFTQPKKPFDMWTSIGFLISMILGYGFPKKLSFMMTTILVFDFYNFIIKDRNVTGEHVIMNTVATFLGFIIGIYFKIGSISSN